MDFDSLIERKRQRFQQLARAIADPRLFDNRKRASEAMREHGNIKQLLSRWDELEAARRQLDENRELAMSSDVEIAAMADDEIPDLQKRVVDLEREMQIALLPPGENEDRDAIVEIRAGTGGSEAAIFAADLYRMYNRYAESAGLKAEDLESSPSELGGLKEVIWGGGAVCPWARLEISGVTTATAMNNCEINRFTIISSDDAVVIRRHSPGNYRSKTAVRSAGWPGGSAEHTQ